MDITLFQQCVSCSASIDWTQLISWKHSCQVKRPIESYKCQKHENTFKAELNPTHGVASLLVVFWYQSVICSWYEKMKMLKWKSCEKCLHCKSESSFSHNVTPLQTFQVVSESFLHVPEPSSVVLQWCLVYVYACTTRGYPCTELGFVCWFVNGRRRKWNPVHMEKEIMSVILFRFENNYFT